MFKVAPRYLSGVSVFLGDDISRRDQNGELAVFIGQATKGPSVPVALNTVENATAIYGTSNPLVKALYEFYDGYVDAGKKQNLKFVTLRVGGKSATLTTSYGLSLKTTDAYDGIENDYFVYVNNTTPEAAVVKIWDINGLLVLDSKQGINTGHFDAELLSIPAGDGGNSAEYGVDIDDDIFAQPVTLAQIVEQDLVGSELTITGTVAVGATSFVVTEDPAALPASGMVKIIKRNGGLASDIEFATYTLNVATKTFTVAALNTAFSTGAKVQLVGSTLIAGDSELNITERELYGKVRNALEDIEMYTPDYVVPGGIAYDTTVTYDKVYNDSTALKSDLTTISTYATVDAAATWPQTGLLDIYDGTTNNIMRYTSNVAVDQDYRLTLSLPVYTIAVDESGLFGTVTKQADELSELFTSGYVTIGTSTVSYTRSLETPTVITFDSAVAPADELVTVATKVPGATLIASVPVLVSVTYTKEEAFEMGIGYVKETEEGGAYTFDWSDTKKVGYNIAHFGYLFANFCNQATVGYNTPLCGMNVTLPSKFDRASIIAWIGKSPEKKVRIDNNSAVEAIVRTGTGLLGESTLAGSFNFNRCYMSIPTEDVWADPAYGLLMTDEGFVDGHEARDTYENTVDLGKFMVVGAGILTFNNKASNQSYYDSCGIYTLGQLAGKPKNEGVSFSKIGTGSNVSVTVIVNRNIYNDLAALGYIVVTREKGLGWVINNSNSAARDNSGYFLISTTRTVKYVVEGKRSILVNFIGKSVNRFIYEAARTALATSFSDDVKNGLLASNAIWDLSIVEEAKAIGKFQLNCKLNPALELTQVSIDAVIDRSASVA